jgi:hypothetical protein
MNDIISELETEDCLTLQNLAVKLLFSDKVNNETCNMITGVLESNNINDSIANIVEAKNQKISDEFQILITLYLEMIFVMLKIKNCESFDNNDMIENDDIYQDVEADKDDIKYDMSEIYYDDLVNVFSDAFNKINYVLHVSEIEDTDMNDARDFSVFDEYYCRIVLKDTYDGNIYFYHNRNTIDPNVRYTFLLRQVPTMQNKNNINLIDLYAVCALPNMKIKISFSKLFN